MTNKPNANYRKDDIPLWINILSGIVIIILIFKTYSCFFNPSLAYNAINGMEIANQKVLWELAGRNICMIVVGLMAIKSQNAMFLAFTFIISIVREGFDMFAQFHFEGFQLQAFTFLIFLIPYFIALNKLRELASKPD